MLDINIFRAEKGFDPERVRESQRRRFSSVEVVDEIINLDKEWRQRQFELENLRKDFNRINKEVARLKIAKEDATEMIKSTNENKKLSAEKEIEVQEAKALLDSKLEKIGNLVHDSVPVSNDEANNEVIRVWGDRRMEDKLKNHVDLVKLLDLADLEKGADVAGGRGFYLKGEGVLLNLALINFGLAFLRERKYVPMQTPFFMRKDIMAKCAQLAQFDEELYKVTGEGDDKYLIATAEQPLCAYHLNDRIYPQDLPIRYAGYSTCFRKEAAAKKYDLEGWFPASKTYRELVSCSNCTDYQARRLGIGFGQKKNDEQSKQYVHMLNSTLTATERTICCILENNQREDGVEIPKALRPFMGGQEFIKFKSAPVETKAKKTKAKGNAGVQAGEQK
ncbi:hypothetical protein J5N97_016128 [Dioscorea zingiberensis]|uniref:serine--tRNA ligase n=1 Tax=Dioscorea zingiberensis TaxID=325984 RepID=A0A9D5HFB9_9LILI|nr:hypothetical protein J5N97_016128 [Dioscorea zingiberensis]